MTEFVEIPGGRIAYDVRGEGPLVVLAHGMGDRRAAYRFVAPRLEAAGYRVATLDMRGHGESSTGWDSVSRTDNAGDILAVIRHLGGPAFLVGHSHSGGAATIAAAQEPEAITALVEICPFTKVPTLDFGSYLRRRQYRRGVNLLVGLAMTGNLKLWESYLRGPAYPGVKPADHDRQVALIMSLLEDPGRADGFAKARASKPSDAEAQLPNIKCPALVIMGGDVPDFGKPRAEAEGIVAAMPKGLGTVAMVEGAGHYPHNQYPDETSELIIEFLAQQSKA
ncbi:alpha/beta fold hydrolase [Nocardia sp. NPDC020380]|uniref:alpha/beta fold hydrolase n=1 Tax=Nocardia sp. NPDC020380 TaxID=3364309 RepID=UPI0037A57D8E